MQSKIDKLTRENTDLKQKLEDC